MVIPQHGQIIFDGRDIRNDWEYRKYLTYVPQIARFPNNLTVQEFFDMLKDLRGNAPHEQRFVHLFRLTPFLKKRLGTLSGGTKQKVNLTAALMFDVPYLFLDEPLAGLDPVSIIRLKEVLQDEKVKGKQIIMTTHVMNIVEEMADEIIFLLEGRIHFRGTPAALLSKYAEVSVERAIAKILDPAFEDIDATPQPNESASSMSISSID
jgi:Cu-processing system ATP-binding protein